MWIVAIAWMYVAVMMAMAEATNPQGTILGAIITLLFYGVAPVALVMYLLSTPARRKARQAAEQTASAQADAGSLPACDPVAPERKEP
ncbi:MAG: hypothetical protein ACOYNB_03855 [Aquabacterium sp.]|uniref:hypothetical protein n=1 Tax=Aquabacterium sp. TaxID=1872578 RepID=UPI003BCA338A